MNECARLLLFVLWLVVVSLACLDFAISEQSVFGRMVLPMAFLPFISRRQFVEPIPRGELWIILVILAVFIACIGWGIVSGFDKITGNWFENSALSVACASGFWLLLICAGISSFRARRFLR